MVRARATAPTMMVAWTRAVAKRYGYGGRTAGHGALVCCACADDVCVCVCVCRPTEREVRAMRTCREAEMRCAMRGTAERVWRRAREQRRRETTGDMRSA